MSYSSEYGLKKNKKIAPMGESNTFVSLELELQLILPLLKFLPIASPFYVILYTYRIDLAPGDHRVQLISFNYVFLFEELDQCNERLQYPLVFGWKHSKCTIKLFLVQQRIILISITELLEILRSKFLISPVNYVMLTHNNSSNDNYN